MGDVSTFTNAAYSFLNSRKEVIMLNSIITPPLLFCYFNKSAAHTCLSGKDEPTS